MPMLEVSPVPFSFSSAEFMLFGSFCEKRNESHCVTFLTDSVGFFDIRPVGFKYL